MRWFSRLLVVLACVAAVVAVLVAGFAVATMFPAGRAAIATLATQVVSAVSDIDLEIEGLDRLTPTAVDVRRADVAMQGEKVATVEGLHVRLRWADLLRARFRPELVHIEQLTVEALPPSSDDKESEPAEGMRIGLPLLPVDAVWIDRLSLAEAVLGEAAEFRISAMEAATAEVHAIDADVQRLDRTGDGLNLRVRYRPAAATLEVHARATEAPGGLLARQVGADPTAAFHAELTGDGPVEGWRGRLTGTLDGVASIAADLGIDNGVGGLVGEARVEPALLPDLAPLLRDAINYRARLRWSEKEGLYIESSRVHVAEIVLGLSGNVTADFSHLQLQLNADLPLAALSPFAGTPLEGRAGALFHIAGSPARPGIAGDVVLSNPHIGEVGSPNALLRLELRTDREGRRRIELSGNVAGLTGLPPAVAPILAERLDLAADLDISPTADEIRLARFSLQGSALQADGDAILRPSGGESQGRFGLRVNVPPGDGPVTGGRMTLDLVGRGELPAGDLRAEGNLQVEELALSDPGLASVIGASPRVVALVTGTAGTPIRIQQFRAELAAGALSANGTFDPSRDELALDVTAEVPDLAALSTLAGQALAGKVELTAHVAGPSGDPSARGQVIATGVTAAAQKIERGEVTFDLQRLVSEPQGRVESAVRWNGADYRLATDAHLRNQAELDLAKLTASAPGVAATGDLTLDIVRLLLRGRANVNATDLAPMAPLAGLPLGGRAQVSARFETLNGQQQVAADIKGNGLRIADVALGSLEGRVKVDDALGTPRGDVALTGRDLVAEGATLNRWQVGAQGSLKQATFTLSLNGEASGPVSAQAAGNAGIDGARWQVGLRSLEARHGNIPVRLDRPTELRGEASAFRLAATEMTVGTAKLSLAGGLAKDQVDGYLRTGAFPLALLRTVQPDLPVRGSLQIDMTASGPAAAPRIAGTVRSNDLRMRRSEVAVALDLALALASGRLEARATVGNLAERPLLANAVVPMRLSLVPWRLEWSAEDPIEGRLSGNLDLARVLPPLIPDGDSVSGVADVQASLAGTLSRPIVNGSMKLNGGRYESATAEATIADLSLDVAAEGENVRLAARGTDGQSGTATVQGRLNLADPSQPLGGTLALRDFWVARRADASVRMAGDVNLAGTMVAPQLAGKLSILQADLQLPEQLPPEVVKLDVVEVNQPANLRRRAPATPAATNGNGEAPLKIGLNLDIGADRRVFVRGRGLESEWRGNLHVGGDSAAPEISGTLEAISGRLDFLAERFILTKGRLVFPGGTRINPDLDIATELTRGELTAIVNVGGTLTAPELSLSARPDLPPEEVISRILFDKGTARLTALQAVQVAQSVMMLSGRGGGPGVVDRIRRATGLDVIDFQSGETADSAGAVSVGKYVSDNVLLRAEKGLDNTGPRAGIEIEVTPNISIESKVGSNAATSVGVKVKKDY